ncbi:hypothetical protein SAMN05660909_02554 [Chitinophaga terrae (ex Kim and Jung 2007)]|jgi:hypothetical protein|uniref:Uncharacterized protein n=1 Tax=Chitinophaga terrae (ex Kim and Jung 2007) TaxID=408074 RepID=A0A1H4CCX4_9BACT|nr:hypothetical protein [Chitinophaga terrae (ex Kim and Jung 2007)]GEP88899.1 hypothetical protein CTE07_05440 [Chitinophaga terrae (ex Kim and Jung 2007)]SEA58214.1 hypothetical protein SAMN05660909_02554 [Chitinophaga terrae (ex Kim and Jung 2007)]
MVPVFADNNEQKTVSGNNSRFIISAGEYQDNFEKKHRFNGHYKTNIIHALAAETGYIVKLKNVKCVYGS